MKDTKLIVAPLHGITNFIFRNVYFKHFKGFDSAMAPFISAKKNGVFKEKQLKDFLPENNTVPIEPQLISNNADDFIFYAKKLKETGYTRVNWNLGCPSPTIVKKKKGSFLLTGKDFIKEFLDTFFSSGIDINLSIKARLGFKNSTDLYNLMEIFNQYPIKIIIHPRTADQLYEGEINYTELEKILSVSKNEIAYSGDIDSRKQFLCLSKKYPQIKEWYIGRGILSYPLIGEIITLNKNPDKTEYINRLKDFYADLEENYRANNYPEKPILNKFKELSTYLLKGFAESKKFSKKLLRSQELKIFKKHFTNFLEYYSEHPEKVVTENNSEFICDSNS